MRRILFITIPLIILAGCSKTISPASQDTISGGIITTSGSLATTFLNQIPECSKGDFSGEVISIDSVVKNCSTKIKYGRITDEERSSLPYYYRVYSGQIGEMCEFGSININDSDEKFKDLVLEDNYYPSDPNKYLCKQLDSLNNWLLYIPYTGDSYDGNKFPKNTINSGFLSTHPLLSQFTLIFDLSIAEISCPNTDKECAQMKEQGLRTDGKNYFGGGILGEIGDLNSVYIINDHFYSPWDIADEKTRFSTKWTFAGIKNNTIIVKKIIEEKEIGSGVLQGDGYTTETKTKYTLKTCEIQLP